jgi:hypothetical protein
MHDVHQAIAVLRERTKLQGLALDGNGRASLVFDGTIAVELRAVDATRLELIAPVDEAGPATTAEKLRGLLRANYVGEATGAGRVAIAPDGDVVLCERLDVTGLDEAALERRVLDFVRHVALWRSGTLDVGPVEPQAEEIPAGDFMMIKL